MIDPVTGIDDGQPEIDPVTGLPVAPSMNPKIKDYLMQKYNLGQYSDENRAKLQQDSQIGLGDKAGAALTAIGAGFQGRDSAAAGQQHLNAAKADKQQAMNDFERGRSAKIQEGDLNRKVELEGRDDKKYQQDQDLDAKESDPSSEESKLAQQLASKLAPGADFSKLSAKQINSKIPSLQKIYEIEQKKLDRQESRTAAAGARSERRQDKETLRVEKEAAGTKDQNAARGFGKRVEAAEKAFNDVKGKGYDRSDLSSAAGAKLPNVLRTDAAVQNEQAERNFINAVLRRESGAAISDSEFKSGETQYFPRAGDGEDTLKQKAENRRMVLEGMKKEAGKTWESTPDEKTAAEKAGKKEVKRQKSPSTGKTKIIYDDGSEEII